LQFLDELPAVRAYGTVADVPGEIGDYRPFGLGVRVPAGPVEVDLVRDAVCPFAVVEARVVQNMRQPVDGGPAFGVDLRRDERPVAILAVSVDQVSEQVGRYLAPELKALFETVVVPYLQYREVAAASAAPDIGGRDVEPAGLRCNVLFGQPVRRVTEEPPVGYYRTV